MTDDSRMYRFVSFALWEKIMQVSFTILDSDGDDLKLTDPDQSTPPFVSFLEGLETFLCHIIDSMLIGR